MLIKSVVALISNNVSKALCNICTYFILNSVNIVLIDNIVTIIVVMIRCKFESKYIIYLTYYLQP